MRAFPTLAVLASLAAVLTAAQAQDKPSAEPLAEPSTEEWERDVAALAPGEDTATTLIVDELTRTPIPGARITWYAEIEGVRAPALGTAVADTYGLASLDWTELATWDADGHFLVTAEGYAAAHEYGRFPPAEIEMVRGRNVTARIVDLLGRPVADADVEVFLGCGHGPILDFVQTDATGRFSVRGQDTDEAQLWLEAPGTAADYLPLDDAFGLGAGERILLLAPGGIAEGVILDSAGRPLEGVEVRSFQRHRGPVAITDRHGHFRLVGVEDEASLYVAHPQAMDGWAILDGDRWRPGVPLRLHLTPWGFAVDTQERVQVDVRVRAPDGRSIEADVSLMRDTDGLLYRSEDVADAVPGILRFSLPPGVYVPNDPYAFGPLELEPIPLDVRAGAPLRVTVNAVARRPRLRVTGDLPDDAVTYVAIEGAAGSSLADFVDEDGEAFVPAEGPVVVTVVWLGRTWFFPAGPEQDGFREVTVALESPHLLSIPKDLHGDFELLRHGVACDIESVDEGFVTFASGNLVLQVTDDDTLLRIPVSLPEEPGATIDITPPSERSARTIRVIPPPGMEDPLNVEITTADGGGFGVYGGASGPVEQPIDGPVWVRVERDDHVVWTRYVEEPGDVHVEWGDASLALHVLDDGNDHVQSTVVVDGRVVPQRDPDDFSVLRVLGLTPGPHTVLLLPHDDAFLAKEMRVVLRAGETRRRRVQLSWRD